jgi:hypothetical protein
MPISEKDVTFTRTLREGGILEDVTPHQINGDGTNVVVMCADGHQSDDQIRTHAHYVKRGGAEQYCCHSLMLNGGALLLSPKLTKRTRLPVRQVLISQIRQALALKGGNTIALYVHAPCGAAKLRKLTFQDVLDHLFLAKAFVKQYFNKRRKLRIVCFVQIDFGNRKRTYYISRAKWEKWKAEQSNITQTEVLTT